MLWCWRFVKTLQGDVRYGARRSGEVLRKFAAAIDQNLDEGILHPFVEQLKYRPKNNVISHTIIC